MMPITVLSKTVIGIVASDSFTDDVGKSQSFPTINMSHYDYTSDNHNQRFGFLGLSLSKELNLNPFWLIQVGIGYYRTPSLLVNGTVTQGIDIESSDKFIYLYQMRSQQLLAEGKLLYNWQQYYHPYISIGLGSAFNNASHYAVNIPPCFTFSPLFSNNKITSFAYHAGLGLDVDLTDHLRLGIGYRFSDLGQFTLGNGPIDDVPNSYTLSQSHMYLNEVLIQLSILL